MSHLISIKRIDRESYRRSCGTFVSKKVAINFLFTWFRLKERGHIKVIDVMLFKRRVKIKAFKGKPKAKDAKPSLHLRRDASARLCSIVAGSSSLRSLPHRFLDVASLCLASALRASAKLCVSELPRSVRKICRSSFWDSLQIFTLYTSSSSLEFVKPRRFLRNLLGQSKICLAKSGKASFDSLMFSLLPLTLHSALVYSSAPSWVWFLSLPSLGLRSFRLVLLLRFAPLLLAVWLPWALRPWWSFRVALPVWIP